MARLIIFANGLMPDIELARRIIRPGDVIYAADGGTRHALALGLSPSVVIGDLDSLASEDRQLLEARAVEIQRYPREKDQTDLELVLDYALQSRQHEILVMGGLGGRLDQTLANISLLSNSRYSSINLRMDDGVEEAFFIRDRSEISGKPGDIVSLIPWGGDVTGISTQGLRWALDNSTLLPGSTRGISNELLGEMASVAVGAGLLLVVHRRSS
jgi:thiamine pyrophosphokinase